MYLNPNLGGGEIFPALQTGSEAHLYLFQYSGYSSQSMLLDSEWVGAVPVPALSCHRVTSVFINAKHEVVFSAVCIVRHKANILDLGQQQPGCISVLVQ